MVRAPLEISPTTLEGPRVRLDPLAAAHLDALSAAGLHEELWRWIPTAVESKDEMKAYLETALQAQAAGTALPFVIVDRATGEVVGSTRFGNIDKANRHVEIGWTWISPRWQRTHVNTEAKFLLLRHAFETLGCLRVELKTDALNEKSRKAILRIGAREEGVLRKNVVVHDGRIRDTVYFSVLDSEWPRVKETLTARLSSR
jgi:RimJ/RimL family protein N-acetyltransferase